MKYNTTQPTTKTENLAGGEAYAETPKLELVSLLLTSFVKDQFYRSEQGALDSVQKLIKKIADKKFVAKSAIYARNEFGMRSISHVVTAELFRKDGDTSYLHGQPWAKSFVNNVIRRPDDATEILAYYKKNVMEKALPKQLKVGLATALQKFDQYQLAKYKGDKNAFKLVDIANLTHPTPTVALDQLMKDTLDLPDTWEVKLTQAGQNAETEEGKTELKAEAWKELLDGKKLGYFALLRNLRNILKQAPDMVDSACEALVNKEAISKSLVLPFRFATAMQEIEKVDGVDTANVRKVMSALNKATDIALSNVPHMEGRTLVVLDESGSMGGNDPKSPFGIGSLFAAVLLKANNADFMGFSDQASYRNLNVDNTVLGIQADIHRKRVNGGTDFHSIFRAAKKPYDRIIILSDMQGWVSYYAPTKSLRTYETKYDVRPQIYSFDLQGYGTLQFPEPRVATLAGFSDKVFDLMKLLEQDRRALINKIESVQL